MGPDIDALIYYLEETGLDISIGLSRGMWVVKAHRERQGMHPIAEVFAESLEDALTRTVKKLEGTVY